MRSSVRSVERCCPEGDYADVTNGPASLFWHEHARTADECPKLEKRANQLEKTEQARDVGKRPLHHLYLTASPLMIATKAMRANIVELLLRLGADPDESETRFGRTTLHRAVVKGDMDTADVLRKHPSIAG